MQSLDEQYGAIIQSTKDAFRVAEAEEPEEMRQRIEQFCKNSLDCVRETSEAQIKEFQNAVGKWSELMAKAGKQGNRNDAE